MKLFLQFTIIISIINIAAPLSNNNSLPSNMPAIKRNTSFIDLEEAESFVTEEHELTPNHTSIDTNDSNPLIDNLTIVPSPTILYEEINVTLCKQNNGVIYKNITILETEANSYILKFNAVYKKIPNEDIFLGIIFEENNMAQTKAFFEKFNYQYIKENR